MSEQIRISSATIFSLENKRVGWPQHTVFESLSLNIKQGEKVALLGKSGSGKSTLLRHLYQQKANEVSFCEQSPGLVPSLSAFHNIYMGTLDQHHFLYNALNLFFPFKVEQDKVAVFASAVGLLDKFKEKAETLSGGQQQRVALARCLIQEKTVFLGDEPVSAVDETQADELLSLIMSKHDTVIVALHHTRQALKHCDRVIGLQNGQIILDQVTQNLQQSDLSQFYSDEASSEVSTLSASEPDQASLNSVF